MEKIIDKIKNQSTVVIGILLIFTFFSLKNEKSFTTPQSIAGLTTLVVAIFLLIGNFFTLQLSENYKFIIGELRGVIDTLKSQQRFSDKRFKNLTTDTDISEKKEEITKGYASDIPEGDTQNE